MIYKKEWHKIATELKSSGLSGRQIAKKIGVSKTQVNDYFSKLANQPRSEVEGVRGPKVLIIDIETKYLLLQGWQLFNQNFSLEQIEEDWSILSFSYKWYGDIETHYHDVTEETEDDLLRRLHSLLDEADFVIAHNGRKFDMKKIRARMVARGFKPYSPVRIIDTLEICKKEFSFTSNKLLYVTNLLCKKNKKSSHGKFAGHLLWKEFIKGNPEAIAEMREYNNLDVDSLEELYDIIAPWSTTLPNFDTYVADTLCGDWEECGYHYSNLGKYRRYRNKETGQYRRGHKNLLSKEKRDSLLRNIV